MDQNLRASKLKCDSPPMLDTPSHMDTKDELSEMLSRNMTLPEAIIYHHQRRNLPFWNNPLHHVGHILLGLVLKTFPGVFKPYSFQGTETAEHYTAQFEEMMYQFVQNDSMRTRDKFIEWAFECLPGVAPLETTLNVIAWRVGGMTGQTFDQIMENYHITWESCFDLANQHGIGITTVGTDLRVDSEDPEKPYVIGQFNVSTSYLPQGSNGIEDFKPYTPYTPEKNGLIYDRAKPALDLVCKIIAPLKDIYDADDDDFYMNEKTTALLDELLLPLTVNDLHDAIQTAIKPRTDLVQTAGQIRVDLPGPRFS